MTPEEEKDSAIRKIKKLLTLAENEGATIGEAMASAEIAQRLMDKHRLTYEFIMSQNPERKREEIIDWIKETGRPFGPLDPPDWASCLINTVAEVNHCQAYVFNIPADFVAGMPKTKALSVAGLLTDVVMCYEVYWHLVGQMIRLSYKNSTPETRTKEWLDSFFLGCTVSIAESLKRVAKEIASLQEVPEGMTEDQLRDAIVLVTNRITKARKALEEKGMKFEETKINPVEVSYGAFQDGVEKGKEIDVNIDLTPKISDPKAKLKEIKSGL